MSYKWLDFSMVDSPNGSAAIVYCRGCALTCKYCFNVSLRSFIPEDDDLRLDEILKKIESVQRFGFNGTPFNTVDWLIITGGEPCYSSLRELEAIITKAKDINLKVGIYTTGIFPDVIDQFIKMKVNWFHFDYKHPGVMQLEYTDVNTLESIKKVKAARIDFVINTTVMKSVHTKEVLLNMKEKMTKMNCDSKWKVTPINNNYKQTLTNIDYINEIYTTEELEFLNLPCNFL